MAKLQSVSVTEFKAKCLELFDRLREREVDQIAVTTRGRVVAVVRAPEPAAETISRLHGWQRGSVTLPPDLDLTAAILDEPWMDRGRGPAA